MPALTLNFTLKPADVSSTVLFQVNFFLYSPPLTNRLIPNNSQDLSLNCFDNSIFRLMVLRALQIRVHTVAYNANLFAGLPELLLEIVVFSLPTIEAARETPMTCEALAKVLMCIEVNSEEP